MSTATVGVRYTPQQYLALERKAATRSEYFEGSIIPMAGTSFLHNMIAGNFYAAVHSRLRDRPGRVCMSDLRVHVGPASLYTYPDVVAVIDEPVLEDEQFDTLLNPTVIIEVLSHSTEAADRGYKFESYRRLDSLRRYVLVAQDRVLVELYTLRGEEWVLSDFTSLDDLLRLDSIDCEVPLREIYAKTDLHGRTPPADV